MFIMRPMYWGVFLSPSGGSPLFTPCLYLCTKMNCIRLMSEMPGSRIFMKAIMISTIRISATCLLHGRTAIARCRQNNGCYFNSDIEPLRGTWISQDQETGSVEEIFYLNYP